MSKSSHRSEATGCRSPIRPASTKVTKIRYELECDVCDHIGAADSMEEAQAMARLHEAFVATLVEKWSLP
jgi:hypothetical protein